ncbi:angiopoietin-related protein 1 [Culex quinquefasciatus]|nr:angiopoietin-related protein 1 [Culex quinquefasciatus]
MARVALAAVVVLIVSVHCSSGQNLTDELGRATNFLLPASCADPPLKQLFTGVHEIQPSPGFGSKIEVLCDQKYDKGGWIVIQNRLDGSVYFEREWAEYKSGFGNLKGEFWLGLDKIHEITSTKKYELVILLTDWSDTVKFAKYSEFRVAGEAEFYAIKKLGTFNGDTTDAMMMIQGTKFSTVDKNNEAMMGTCVTTRRGGWWYIEMTCGDSNLNGLYQNGGTGGVDLEVNFWTPIQGTNYGLKATRMMIRPKK